MSTRRGAFVLEHDLGGRDNFAWEAAAGGIAYMGFVFAAVIAGTSYANGSGIPAGWLPVFVGSMLLMVGGVAAYRPLARRTQRIAEQRRIERGSDSRSRQPLVPGSSVRTGSLAVVRSIRLIFGVPMFLLTLGFCWLAAYASSKSTVALLSAIVCAAGFGLGALLLFQWRPMPFVAVEEDGLVLGQRSPIKVAYSDITNWSLMSQLGVVLLWTGSRFGRAYMIPLFDHRLMLLLESHAGATRHHA